MSYSQNCSSCRKTISSDNANPFGLRKNGTPFKTCVGCRNRKAGKENTTPMELFSETPDAEDIAPEIPTTDNSDLALEHEEASLPILTEHISDDPFPGGSKHIWFDCGLHLFDITCYQHYDVFKAARAKIRFTLNSMCFAGVDEVKYETFHKLQGIEIKKHFRLLRQQQKRAICSDYFMERFITQYAYIHNNMNEFGFITDCHDFHVVFRPNGKEVLDILLTFPYYNIFENTMETLIYKKERTCHICYERRVGEFVRCCRCKQDCCRACYELSRKSMRCPYCRHDYMAKIVLQAGARGYTLDFLDMPNNFPGAQPIASG